MNELKIRDVCLKNFKGCRELNTSFGDKTIIRGANAVGKSTIVDAISWLLFNKDSSGSTDFSIRPLDADGHMVDNIDINVTVEIEFNGEFFMLSKTQRQVWRKKRGTDVKTFQGNVNEYEIDGYPKTEKEFREFLDGVITEKYFQILSNPTTFTNMPWEKQRDFLMALCGGMSDVEFAEAHRDSFELLIPELKKADASAIQKKYTKEKSKLNAKMDEIPARIDEISMTGSADVDALESKKTEMEAEVEKIDRILGETSYILKFNELKKLFDERKADLADAQTKAKEALSAKKSDLYNTLSSHEGKLRELDRDIDKEKLKASFALSDVRDLESSVEKLRGELSGFNDLRFVEPEKLTEKDLTCPICGQKLPGKLRAKRISEYTSMRDSKKREFELHKSMEQKRIQESIAEKLKGIESAKELAESGLSKVNEMKAQADALAKRVDTIKADIGMLPENYEMTDEMREILKEVTHIEKKLSDMGNAEIEIAELKVKRKNLVDGITEMNGMIRAGIVNKEKTEKRIAELQEEQRACGQDIANCERMLDLADEFIRSKMKAVETSVGEHFGMVSFKLFETQINGGVKECCECTVGGVPYSSLNSGHRILAGLDIIHAFGEMLQIHCPVFVDNAESLNEFNIPDMDNQMILLKVADGDINIVWI